MACALASKSGSWLLSQYTLRCGLSSASSRIRQRLERLMGRKRCWGRAATRSSRLQRVAGQWEVTGFWVAIDSTSTRSEGGNAPRTTRTRRIVQAGEAIGQRALPPSANRMTLVAQVGGHLEIRGLISGGDPEEHPTAKGQRLRGGMGPHKRLDPGMVI